MADIQIAITEKRPQVIGAPVIVCGNSDYTITFNFDAEWGAGTKTARFVYIRDGAVMHEDVVFSGSTVAVPILDNVREVRVGVYAGNLQTSTPVVIPCECSIRCGTGAPADPTPSQYDQIIALLQSNNTAIAGIQVGGRNYLRNSKLDRIYQAYWRYAEGVNYTISDDSMTITKDATATRLFTTQSSVVNPQILPEQGETYTLSIEAKKIAGIDIGVGTSATVRYNHTDGVSFDLQVSIPSDLSETSWTKLSNTRTYSSTKEITYVDAIIALASTACGVCVRHIKLEKGNHATDWTPAPEDAENAITSLEGRVAALEASLLAMGGEG